MADEISQVISILSRMAVFKPLKPPELEQLVLESQVLSLAPDEILFEQESEADAFYVMLSGMLSITRNIEGRTKTLASVVPGDYVGEEALLYGTLRTATIVAATPSRVLRLSYDQFANLIQTYPAVVPYFIATVESRRLARATALDWLNPDETVYLIARKSRIILLFSLLKPFLLGWLSIPALWLGYAIDITLIRTIFELTGGGVLALAVVWGVWRYLDWGNDYYIVTNQRVIWLEKVIGLYDSRQEAPLGTVVSVGVTTDQKGRWFHYGDVVIRTFTGAIVMHNVGNPGVLQGLVEEQVARGKQRAAQLEKSAIERAIRTRLGFDEEPPKPPPLPPPPERHLTATQKMFAGFFKMRLEEGERVTFRKHWAVLIGEIWQPTLAFVLVQAMLVLRGLNVYAFVSGTLVLAVWLVLSLATAFWWGYNYVDWRNDIYQLTDDQIIDIYRKPFGTEEKKTAALDNILSLTNKRIGIIGLFFNFGDVTALVGADKFIFKDVFNPAGVEQEIFHRIAQRRRRAREAEQAQQRENIADWLAAYHQQVTDVNHVNPPTTG